MRAERKHPASGANSEAVIRRTRHWIEQAVIGLNLCPFAGPVYQQGLLDLVISPSVNPREISDDLAGQLVRLAQTPPEQLESILLLIPNAFDEFEVFNQFLTIADQQLGRLELTGKIQIASFHPEYRFAGTQAGDPTNNTNRSPYPALHLLREHSITRVIEAGTDTEAIVQRNLQTMTRLGGEGWQRLLRPKA